MNRYIIDDLNTFCKIRRDFLPQIERKVFKYDTCSQGCDLNMIRGICIELSELVKHIRFLYNQIKNDNECEDLTTKWKLHNKSYVFYDSEEDSEDQEEYYNEYDLGYEGFDNFSSREESKITQFYYDLISKYYQTEFSVWAKKINLSMICENHIFNEKIKRKKKRDFEKKKPMVFLGLVKSFGGNDYMDPDEMVRFWQADLSLLSEIFKTDVQNWAINFECYCCR